MTTWMIFIVGSLLLILVIVGRLFLNRNKQSTALESKKPVEDARILYLLLWMATFSILAYIVFVFGKR